MNTSSGLGTISTGSFRRLLRGYGAHRYAVLFYTLLTTIAAGPLLDAIGVQATFLEVFLGLNLVAAAAPIFRGGKAWVITGVVATVLVARYLAKVFDYGSLAAVSLGAWSLIGIVAAGSALRFALRARRIDSEHLYAALDAYLLVGIFLGVLYWTLQRESSTAFSFNTAQNGEAFTAATGIYFSFVTLATLGYGDITPRSEAVRGMAIVEAVAGQLYLAVMISRLVSLQTAARHAGPHSLATTSCQSDPSHVDSLRSGTS